jgi:hypothetical protein
MRRPIRSVEWELGSDSNTGSPETLRALIPPGLGGTSTHCSVLLTEDSNTFIASGSDPALSAGASVWL